MNRTVRRVAVALNASPARPVPDDPTVPPEPTPTPDVPLTPPPTPEEPTMPPITPPDGATHAPSAPEDVIVPRVLRGWLLLGSWLAVTIVAGVNAAFIYMVEQTRLMPVEDQIHYPLWLGVLSVVVGFASGQINLIARANLNPPKD